MKDMENLVKKIEYIARNELKEKYKDGKRLEKIMSVDAYDSLPITSAKSENELPIVLRDVVVIIKKKIADNKKIIDAYEVYDQSERKLLETMDDGRIKMDREIIDDKLKDMIASIKRAGFEPAGMDSIEKNGQVDSFFKMINDKVVAINREQKEMLERSEDSEHTLLDISKRSIDAKKVDTKKEQNKSPKINDENRIKQELSEEGIDAVKITKEIEDPIFKQDNSHIEGARAVLTRDARVEIVKEENGKLKRAEGFKNSTAKRGETFVAWNDDVNIGDQVHTYGEIKGKNGDKTYSTTIDKYGDLELIENRENLDGHMEQREEKVSMGVHTKGDAYYKANREGDANSNNITQRSRDTRSTNKDTHYNGDGTGKGGIHEIAKANKEHMGAKDYTMDDFSAHTNPRLEDALDKFHDKLKEHGISLDSEVKANTEENIKKFLEKSSKPFCEEKAEEFAMKAQAKMDAKQSDEEEKTEPDEEKGRVRIEEAARARRHPRW